jgi:hypothetical protein
MLFIGNILDLFYYFLVCLLLFFLTINTSDIILYSLLYNSLDLLDLHIALSIAVNIPRIIKKKNIKNAEIFHQKTSLGSSSEVRIGTITSFLSTFIAIVRTKFNRQRKIGI